MSSFDEARYDRQLRLWGEGGQQALLNAHVLALGATATIAEVLKTTVLTGVKAITIVDEREVTSDILAENFFVSPTNDGGSKWVAENMATNLASLNTDCVCLFSTLSPQEWVNGWLSQLWEQLVEDAFILKDLPSARQWLIDNSEVAVVQEGADADEQKKRVFGGKEPLPISCFLVSSRYPDLAFTSPLAVAVRQLNLFMSIPMFTVETSGLLGFFEPLYPNTIIVAGNNDNNNAKKVDLRIANPFPTLLQWFEKHDPNSESLFPRINSDGDGEDLGVLTLHSHIPFVVILHYAMRHLKEKRTNEDVRYTNDLQHNNALTKDLKSEIDLMIRRTDPPQEAFMEAKNQCKKNIFLLCDELAERIYKDGYLNDLRVREPSLGAFRPLLSFLRKQTISQISLEIKLDFIFSQRDPQKRVLLFYVLHAVNFFYETHKVFPFNNNVPDMHTTTDWFRELKEIYNEKHLSDVAEIAEIAYKTLADDLLTYNHVTTKEHLVNIKNEDALTLQAWLKPLAAAVVQNVYDVEIVNFDCNVDDNSILQWCGALNKKWVIEKEQYEKKSGEPNEVLSGEKAERELSPSDTLGRLVEDINVLWYSRLMNRITSFLKQLEFLPDSDFRRNDICLYVAYMGAQDLRRRHYRDGLSLLNENNLERNAEKIIDSLSYILSVDCSTEATASAPKCAEEANLGVKTLDQEKNIFNRNTIALMQKYNEELLNAAKEVARTFNFSCSTEDESFPYISEIPSIVGAVGAVLSQEVIKLLQGQRVPVSQPKFYSGYTNTMVSPSL